MKATAISQKTNPIAGSTPWKKGQSGNPSGRPKTAHFAEEARKFLFECKGDKTRLRLLAERLFVDDPKTLLAYAFGKPVETHQVLENQTAFRPEIIQLGREIAASLHSRNGHGNGH